MKRGGKKTGRGDLDIQKIPLSPPPLAYNNNNNNKFYLCESRKSTKMIQGGLKKCK